MVNAAMTEAHANFEEVRASLERLAERVFSATEPSGTRTYFAEFIREYEFGLALHVICDYLRDKEPGKISADIIIAIENLHKSMKMDDDECVGALRQLATRKR